MYVVRNVSNNVIAAICSRPEDAQAWIDTKIDGVVYIIEKQGMRDQLGSLGLDPDEKISKK